MELTGSVTLEPCPGLQASQNSPGVGVERCLCGGHPWAAAGLGPQGLGGSQQEPQMGRGIIVSEGSSSSTITM